MEGNATKLANGLSQQLVSLVLNLSVEHVKNLADITVLNSEQLGEPTSFIGEAHSQHGLQSAVD